MPTRPAVPWTHSSLLYSVCRRTTRTRRSTRWAVAPMLRRLPFLELIHLYCVMCVAGPHAQDGQLAEWWHAAQAGGCNRTLDGTARLFSRRADHRSRCAKPFKLSSLFVRVYLSYHTTHNTKAERRAEKQRQRRGTSLFLFFFCSLRSRESLF